MSKRSKLLTSLLLVNVAAFAAAWGFFPKKSGGYLWRSQVEWFFVSRNWEPITVVMCVSGLLTLAIYLMLDSFGKLPLKAKDRKTSEEGN